MNTQINHEHAGAVIASEERAKQSYNVNHRVISRRRESLFGYTAELRRLPLAAGY